MVALPSVGEFNRVDRDGDFMEGDLDHRDKKVQYTDGAGNEKAYQRATLGATGQMVFYDEEVGVEKTLLELVSDGLAVNLEEEIVATVPGQAIFDLVTGTYVPGTKTVHVFLRVAFVPRSLFVETSTTRITLAPSVAATVNVGDILTVTVFKGVGTETNTVKGDITDTGPNNLNAKLNNGSGLTKNVTGPVTDRIVNLAVDHATAIPPASAGIGAVGIATKSAREDHQHPAPAPGNPAVDELKNATVVNSSSFLQNGTAGPTRYYIDATSVQAHRWHWASCWAVSAVISGGICRVDHFMHYVSQRDAGGVLIATKHQLALDVTTGGAGNHTIYHRTYRADET
jgi:hypothetical protein